VIHRLCNKALWLRKGEVAAFGDTKSVVERYKADQLGTSRPMPDMAPA